MHISPYLFFDGRCEEAVTFYRQAIGAQVRMMMPYKDHPDPSQLGDMPPGSEEKIIHGELRIGQTTVMVSDGRCQGKATFQGFALTLTFDDAAEADRVFAALSEGGQVRMPLGKTFFSPRFGMVTDKFGVMWMIIVHASHE